MDTHDILEISLSLISFLNELELILSHNCIAIVSTQLNSFNYCYITLITVFEHYSFVCTPSNGSKYCYVSLTIQLNIGHSFTQLDDWKVLFQFSLALVICLDSV